MGKEDHGQTRQTTAYTSLVAEFLRTRFIIVRRLFSWVSFFSLNQPHLNYLDQSVWKLDTTIANPKWTFVTGSNSTSANAVINGHPVPSYGVGCDAAKNSGAYCFGGTSYANGLFFSSN